jgi:hypothetical protein
MFRRFGRALRRFSRGFLFRCLGCQPRSFNLKLPFLFTLSSLECRPSFRFLRGKLCLSLCSLLRRRVGIPLCGLMSCPFCPVCRTLGIRGTLRLGSSLHRRSLLGRQLGILLRGLMSCPLCPVCRTLGLRGALRLGSSLRRCSMFGLSSSLRRRGPFGFGSSLCSCGPLGVGGSFSFGSAFCHLGTFSFSSSVGVCNQFCLSWRIDPLALCLCRFLNPEPSRFPDHRPRSREISILCAVQIRP